MKRIFYVLLVVLLIGAVSIAAVAASGAKDARITYRDIQITLDGEVITPTDVSGNPTEPFLMDDTTYLPVRAVAEALGLDVAWDEESSTIALTTPEKEPDAQEENQPVTPAETSLPEEETIAETSPVQSASYTWQNVTISANVPEGWSYEVISKEQQDQEDGLVLFSLVFSPDEYPDVHLELGYWANTIGICGTGVTFEELIMPDGSTASFCTEHYDNLCHLMVIYPCERGSGFMLEGSIPEECWTRYEQQIRTELAPSARLIVEEMTSD